MGSLAGSLQSVGMAHLLPTCSKQEDMQTRLITTVAWSPSGNLFLGFQEDFEQVYKVYCANYDQALLLLEAYQKEPELQREIQTIVQTVL